jgi:hypothetical protein
MWNSKGHELAIHAYDEIEIMHVCACFCRMSGGIKKCFLLLVLVMAIPTLMILKFPAMYLPHEYPMPHQNYTRGEFPTLWSYVHRWYYHVAIQTFASASKQKYLLGL